MVKPKIFTEMIIIWRLAIYQLIFINKRNNVHAMIDLIISSMIDLVILNNNYIAQDDCVKEKGIADNVKESENTWIHD